MSSASGGLSRYGRRWAGLRFSAPQPRRGRARGRALPRVPRRAPTAAREAPGSGGAGQRRPLPAASCPPAATRGAGAAAAAPSLLRRPRNASLSFKSPCRIFGSRPAQGQEKAGGWKPALLRCQGCPAAFSRTRERGASTRISRTAEIQLLWFYTSLWEMRLWAGLNRPFSHLALTLSPVLLPQLFFYF